MPILAADLVRQVKSAIQPLYPTQEVEAIAYLLVEMSTGATRMDCHLNKEVEKPNDWEQMLSRLAEHEPWQYVLGKAWFRDRIFELNPHTLIPRPETEELVDLVLEKLPHKNTPYSILDVGTGSGCIAISIALEAPNTQVSAWEISNDAQKQAMQNAKSLGAKVSIERQDVFEWSTRSDTEMWDMIVSNPPYVLFQEASQMEKHVTDFEPGLALFVPDSNPLIFYQVLENMASKHLRKDGWILLEINQSLGQETKALFLTDRWRNIELRQDFHGKDRFVLAQKDI
ncbi:peptide chain release factor N(5)-glutamine methyltransferase [Aquirufa aurantiipilula]|uniref:peptide chain release factor N(5)-glutamine methyltransferase n=1 Tax=Aquirufa aurantiipilula TaxID=2696561 RepID=A0ABT6BJ55_9BACT|nr:peptide chain release factor N(5)-glutamine methyltransferase [Aquirufa aurantiipilula]MDF5690417.1 peptide chain release factor N(5)-glutamine methyltransferase [Aquirufa aurantiipilula]